MTVPTREELERLREQPPRGAPQLDIGGDIERSPCPLADPKYRAVPVTISGVTFGNLKGATPGELEPAWRPFAGRPQPVAVICEIRDAAATILRNKGYLAAVQVPTQRIEDGQLRLEVLYARIVAIRARGETAGAEEKLQQYLGHLAEDEIFDRDKAERYLLLARDLPGYNVQLTLRPADSGPGELIGEVSVLRQPYAVDLTVQNLGAEATGRWGGQVRAQAFGLTGMGDATSIAYYTTADFEEQHILQGGHEFRPGGEGLTVGGQLTYAWTKPDLGTTGPGAVQLRARTLYASLTARYPMVRSQGRNVWLGGALDLVNQDVDLIGPLTRDRLRVASVRLDYDAIDLRSSRPRWSLGGTVELRQGLDVLDATSGCIGAACVGTIPVSRADGSATATLVRAGGEGVVAFGDLALSIAPRAQYAFKPLLSFEEFTAGNYTVGRGYDPGTLAGDHGVGVAAELLGPRLGVGLAENFSVQPYLFSDAAWVWNRGVDGSQRLVSVGAGVRAELGDRLRLEAILAVPTERAGLLPERGKARLLISLTSRILPWRTR